MKNKTMRAASILMVAVLLSTCAISGTFAKYVTSDNGTDTARVAKWGVTIDVFNDLTDPDTDEMFGTQYDNEISTSVKKVLSSNGNDVIAPGTEGTLAKVTISGTPEVVVDLKADVDIELTGWVDSTSAVYFPLVITVGTTPVDFSSCDTIDKVEVAIEDAIIKAIISGVTTETSGTGRTATKRYDANNPFASDADADVIVTWEWPFSINDANDVKDTYLGDQAAVDAASTITIDYTVTATQVD